ncbi:aldehyde dehydrogenase family protein [Kineococcus indalonis]|uniref:aldehyde dehydrogenase family protein n=1 Tax=Kineococcus indalonis TaxID=2696566 RepID=UPI0014122B5E|nr:aldehyde dehydrogenase family protein [Kineococcus indalonis]NAZ87656.1 aldehyde dehydrogenase family protein [Kineococcus indalonis]
MTAQDAAPGTFEVRAAGTGELVGTFPVQGEQDVAAAVARAREAARWWGELGFAGRRRRLDAFRGLLARQVHRLAAVVREETTRPTADAVLEVALTLEHVAWAARNAERVLGPRRVRTTALSANLSASVERKPLGVVGVIGPWNFPVFTPLGSIVPALAAGNAVVYKPSELAPGVGAWLVEAFARVVPEQPVLQLLTGDASTGEALCRGGVDKIAFTGSTAAARRVMAACAGTLTPLVAECGGKDAFVVDEDADVEAAARAAVWSAVVNAGQTCIGTERVYVHRAVHDAFVAALLREVRGVRAGTDPGAVLGPLRTPAQAARVEAHVADAVARGGRVLFDGGPAEGTVVQPVVLADVPDEALANQEETFGPLLTVRAVADVDEAVRRANGTRYGLGATVFGGRGAERVARRLRTGAVSVNCAFGFAQVPTLPFGGVGDSGFGRVHGPDGLREFSAPQALARQRFRLPLAVTGFARSARDDARVAALLGLVHGRR